MASLTNRAALRGFSIALIVSAALDALSTIYAAHCAGTWAVEDNPVFRGLGGSTSGPERARFLLFAMKAASVGVSIFWLRLTLMRIPSLYPQLGRQLGRFQFINFLFCGVEVRGWRALFLIPRPGRLYVGLSVPVAMAAILGQFSASLVNTFHFLDKFFGVVVFWLAVAALGTFAGLEMLRRDFISLSRDHRAAKPFT